MTEAGFRNEGLESLFTSQQNMLLDAEQVRRGWILWLTGLPAAGKSTLASALVKSLQARHRQVFHLDGDLFRQVFSKDLGFSAADRAENLRRAAALACLLTEGGMNVVAAFVSPYRADRESIREIFPTGSFAEVFVRCPLQVCEQRDPKGLYVRARAGELREFTGVSAPYEEPVEAELVLDSDREGVADCVSRLEVLALRLENEAGLLKNALE